MRFDLTVYADTPDELNDALGAVRASLPADIFSKHRRGFRIEAHPTHGGPNVLAAPPMPPLSGDEPPPAVASAETAKRTRRTREQIAADNAAAEAAKRAAAEPDPLATGPQDGDADPGQDADNDDPLGLGSDPEPVASSTGMAPAEAKLKALEILRKAFVLPGGTADIKAIQTRFGVTKFVEIPDARGNELHTLAVALLAKLEKVAA